MMRLLQQRMVAPVPLLGDYVALRRYWVVAGLGIALAFSGAAACAQPLIPNDGVIPLLDTPIMQQPLQHGAQSLMQMQSPPAVQTGKVNLAPLATMADTTKLCDAAVKLVAEQKIEQAFAALTPYWPLAREEINRLAGQTKSQFALLVRQFGAIVGQEWVRSRTGGKSLVQHLYMVKLQHHAVRVGCTFYRPEQTWQVHTIFWDDEIDALLEP
ncbi:hypothetical protein E9531_08180 [Lampropedia puyangensis]|uniref:DUF4019 domain-containing protein n=1 Tax=Lampropedia puyangensis TaxID=1330072 RepID=A0A4S8F4D5_9BURK|nr:hypothetical protein [Lampropedia puyangensis]THU01967.1 hypothetical protein E9531_08180 [Lampropedia puyangensis]